MTSAPMATQEEYLEQIWQSINRTMDEKWIDQFTGVSKRDPSDHFDEVGLAVQRLLNLGASRRDLSLLVRHGGVDQEMKILYLLSDAGIDDNEVENLYTIFFDADPNVAGGMPGPAPQRNAARKSTTSSEGFQTPALRVSIRRRGGVVLRVNAAPNPGCQNSPLYATRRSDVCVVPSLAR
jgi:hypothetical protein